MSKKKTTDESVEIQVPLLTRKTATVYLVGTTPLICNRMRDGAVVRELTKAPREAGLHRVAWALDHEPPRPRRVPDAEEQVLTDYDDEADRRGPRALPGAYLARLTLGTLVLEAPVAVRLDPTLDVAEADLAKANAAALEIRDRLQAANDALRGLDSVKAQLEERAKLLRARQAPEELRKTLTDGVEALEALADRIQKDPAKRYWASGPKLVENLEALGSAIDATNAAPTAAQLAHLEELKREAAERLAEAAAFLERDLGRLNDAHEQAGLPEVVGPAATAADVALLGTRAGRASRTPRRLRAGTSRTTRAAPPPGRATFVIM